MARPWSSTNVVPLSVPVHQDQGQCQPCPHHAPVCGSVAWLLSWTNLVLVLIWLLDLIIANFQRRCVDAQTSILVYPIFNIFTFGLLMLFILRLNHLLWRDFLLIFFRLYLFRMNNENLWLLEICCPWKFILTTTSPQQLIYKESSLFVKHRKYESFVVMLGTLIFSDDNCPATGCWVEILGGYWATFTVKAHFLPVVFLLRQSLTNLHCHKITANHKPQCQSELFIQIAKSRVKPCL